MVTGRGALILLLSSIPLIGKVLAAEGLKVYLPGETYDKGVWSRLTARSI